MNRFHRFITHDPERRFRVLASLQLHNTAGQQKLAGIFAYLDSHPEWELQLIRTQEELSPKTLNNATTSGLDGIIVSIERKTIFKALAEIHCPVIVMDNDPPEIRQRKTNLVVIRNDSRDIVRASIKLFSTVGRFNSFAYVNSRHPTDWSKQREKAFLDISHGNAAVLASTGSDDDQAILIDFLKRLEQPIALLAANDIRAADVIAAAKEASIKIPNQLSVLGIDNDPYVCNRISPTLSSLEPDFFKEGHTAANLLNKLMHARTPVATKHVYIGVKRIVLRDSLYNLPPAQGLVTRANDFIHNNATSGITPQHVAEHLGISRQLLDLRFREAGKGSVGQIILKRKLAEVKSLLTAKDTPIGQIAGLCGFKNDNALKNTFKNETGISMREWRKGNVNSAPSDNP